MRSNFISVVCGWVAMLMSLLLSFSAPTYAQHHGASTLMLRAPLPMKQLLEAVDATPEQRQAIRKILKEMAADIQSRHQAHQALMLRSTQLLAAPEVDEVLIEQNRQQMLSEHDAMSKRLSTASIEVAKLLTPEQRTRLGPFLQHHMQHHMPRHSKEMRPTDQGGAAKVPAVPREAAQ